MNKVNHLDISIVILSYNSKIDLERLLPSIWGSDGVRFVGGNGNADVVQGRALPTGKQATGLHYIAELIIVDNGSTNGTVDWLPTTNYPLLTIRNANNGFAHGNNLGIKAAKGKYLLILNPDTKLEKDTLKVMFEFMETNPEVGISTCKVLMPNGKLDLACRRRFPNPWNSFLRLLGISKSDYNMLDTDENASQEIDSCMGAFMLCRRLLTTHYSLPTFDESFFMYGEDLDLCWRVKEAGYKVWYYPKTSITHYKGSSSRKTPFKALKWFHEAMWIFYKKHYAAKYPFFLNWLVYLGIYARMILLVVFNYFKKNPKVS